MDTSVSNINSAVQDFYRARNKAMMKEIIARITGESIDLLSYDEVRDKLKVKGVSEKGLRDIQLDAIVGSLGRYNDFTRDFLPRKDTTKDRWTRIKLIASGLIGLPPIEVYQIGGSYFVKDGNHRVSVARQLGAKSIQAYVTEVRTRVPLSPNDDPNDLILKSEYANFLEKTHIDEYFPGVDFTVSVVGNYPILVEHISVHRYFMGIDLQREISYEEAVKHWYINIYLPVVNAIRDQGILHNFPGRSEADLYIWISEHRAAMEKELGWKLQPETAISVLRDRFDNNWYSIVRKIKERILLYIFQGKFVAGPPPGYWRKEISSSTNRESLFRDILVPVSGDQDSWCALELALNICYRENAILYGLHVLPDIESEIDEKALQIQTEFNQRCRQANVKGELVFGHGEPSRLICDRSRFMDLIITNLSFPPGIHPQKRLESGFHEMVQKCPRPILATPKTTSPLNKALLAYDGSPKANEALFITNYIAMKWQISVVVLSVVEKNEPGSAFLTKAFRYFQDYAVKPVYIEKRGLVHEEILASCREYECDMIIMGGYGKPPLAEVVLGSAVNYLLQNSHLPIMICR